MVPTQKLYCRLCQHQAKLQLGVVRIRGPVSTGVRFCGWQLFFADMPTARVLPVEPEPGLGTGHAEARGQMALLSCTHDFLRFSSARLANPSNPALIAARRAAQRRRETYGWSHWLAREVDRALVALLSQHIDGDHIRYSEIIPLDGRSMNVSRTAEVLSELDLLIDDRPDRFGDWLQKRLTDLAPAIADDVRLWATSLRSGQYRTKVHDDGTVRNYLRQIHPFLVLWSTNHDHLREITSEEIHCCINDLHGLHRRRVIVSLRSLFSFLHRNRKIFADPAARIKPGVDDINQPRRMPDGQLQRIARASMTPTRRLLVALTAVHAARPMHLTALLLDDVDLANRRITVGGRTRHLDDLTRQLLIDYLNQRRQRWPRTSNPHLLVTEQSGHETRPVTSNWLNCEFRAIGATPTQLRIDRQLEEAITHGPDPLHLAAMFGIAENTAVRYARAARQLLTTDLEVHA
jgi:site-specific recombinase XerD